MQGGATPLYFASLNGHVAVVRLLLERRAGVNICGKVSCCKKVDKYYCARTEHMEHFYDVIMCHFHCCYTFYSECGVYSVRMRSEGYGS